MLHRSMSPCGSQTCITCHLPGAYKSFLWNNNQHQQTFVIFPFINHINCISFRFIFLPWSSTLHLLRLYTPPSETHPTIWRTDVTQCNTAVCNSFWTTIELCHTGIRTISLWVRKEYLLERSIHCRCVCFHGAFDSRKYGENHQHFLKSINFIFHACGNCNSGRSFPCYNVQYELWKTAMFAVQQHCRHIALPPKVRKILMFSLCL